jgi:hypothetical protein
MVRLRNEPVDGTPVLPIRAADQGAMAMIGQLADEPDTTVIPSDGIFTLPTCGST